MTAMEKYMKNYRTFSRLTGSLKAESITSFVGTIFHFGIISSTCVSNVMTTGCGFTFSDICYAKIPEQTKK
jgi:hypothetical protein